MREALYKREGWIGIGGRVVTNLTYADDTTLIAGRKEDLIEITERVRKAREKAGLKLIYKCPKDEAHDYRIYCRGDSG